MFHKVFAMLPLVTLDCLKHHFWGGSTEFLLAIPFLTKHGISRTAGSRVEKCLAKTKHVKKLFQWVVSTYPMIKVKAGLNIVFPKTCKNTVNSLLFMQLYWRHWKATRTREEDTLAFSVLASVKSGEEATAYSSVSFSLWVGFASSQKQLANLRWSPSSTWTTFVKSPTFIFGAKLGTSCIVWSQEWLI